MNESPTDAEESLSVLVQRLTQEAKKPLTTHELVTLLGHVHQSIARVWLEKAREGGSDIRRRHEHLQSAAGALDRLQDDLINRLSCSLPHLTQKSEAS